MLSRLLVMSFLVGSLAAAAGAQSVQAGPLEARFAGSRGYGLMLNGVPISRGSSLQVYAPGWKQGYYSSRGDHVTAGQQRDALILTHNARKIDFHTTETVRAIGNDRLEITLKGTLASKIDARLEWGLATINTFALYGGSVGRGGSDALIAIVPEPSAKRDPESLVGQAGSIRVATRVGHFIVKVEKGPDDLVLLDGRRNPGRSWSSPDQPAMWLGILGAPLKPGEEFEYRVSIQLLPEPTTAKSASAPASQPPLGVDASARQSDRAFVPPTHKVQIIPTPKQLKWTDGHLAIGPKTLIVIGVESARPAAELLARQIKQRFGWDWRIRLWKEAPPGSIVIGRAADQDRKDAKPESYHLDCDGKTAAIWNTPSGYRYGVQTLLQLVQSGAEGASVPGCAIYDYPSLAFRGVHLFTGRDSVDFYRRLAENVLARFKFNHVVLECDYTEWDTDKQIWTKQSVPKSQVAQYVKISREAGLEPIPLVQSLGHSQWMFANQQNLDLAEDPQLPYAYAVTNPKTYEFIRAVYQEAIDLFDKPKYFHIGHDEVDMLGRYPQRAAAKKLGKSELLALDLARLEQFFKPKGMTMMLWGDMLIAPQEVHDGSANAPSPEEAKQRRDAVPRDAVICDWHYQPNAIEDFNSLKIFAAAGFKTIACTWYNPQNIYNFAAAARRFGAWGLLQTTWAGYHITQDTLDREARQFSAYVLAAEYAWSGDSPPPQNLPWRAEEVLADAMNPWPLETRVLSGHVLAVGGTALKDFLGYADLSPLAKQQRIGGTQFDIAGARLLGGRLLSDRKHPTSIILRTKLKADTLAFLQATAFPAAQGAPVGSYEVRYADGATEQIVLNYGRDIRWWEDLAPAAAAPVGWFGQSANGTPAAARIMSWRNPHPEKTILSITFSTDHPYASPVLFAITALNEPAQRK